MNYPIRKEGKDKVTGQSKYIDDIKLPEMLYGVTVRSSVARGKIKNIEFKSGLPWNEIIVVSAKDIPGKNVVTVLETDQPLLAEGFVNHHDEAVLLLAHKDKYIVERARQLVEITYEELPAVFSIEESLEAKTVIWGKDNIFKKYNIEKGDVDSIWNKASHIIEETYRTGAQEQLYIENNGMIATADPKQGITVWGSMQCPYYIHKGMLPIFNLPEDKIRIIQTETGGGFGGKEEYPTILAAHAALLALKSGQPVKMIYSRSEDIAATTKRHPSRTKIKTAHDSSGRLLAIDIEFILDGGAYLTLTPVVLSRGTIHAAGPYYCENTRIKSLAVATNFPPHGAFRGFGAPQSIFAFERHLDIAAEKIGISPVEIRRKNFLKKGQLTATNQLIKEEIEFDNILDRALEASDYYRKISQYSKQNQNSPIKKGIGLATFMHGAGFTGSGEKNLASVVAVEVTSEGKVKVLSSSTEIGQGKNTVFAQVAAETFRLNYEDIEVVQPDTSKVPNSGPTVASRTAMVVGALVQAASQDVLQQLYSSKLLKTNYSREDFKNASQLYLEKFGMLKAYSQYKQPEGIQWDDQKYQGDAYATFAWACYIADVAVDMRTYETTVENFVAVQEIGRVLHPILAEGQIEGGVAQAIGYALYEKVQYQNGRVINNQMTNYIMPTSVDLPNIQVIFEEKNKNYGPGGAKGIGELPMDGPAPAILNAIHNATGVVAKEIPLLPEDFMSVCEASL